MADPSPVPTPIAELARGARRVAVLTGAGMSAESGVPTFRDAQTGLWARFDAESLATPEAFAADPGLVWAWYLWRHRLVRQVQPNAGHTALAQWARPTRPETPRTTRADTLIDIVTQNVDDLHERAGSQVLAHLHGSLFAFRCSVCAQPYELDEAVSENATDAERVAPPHCAACDGLIRPGVVWFGEPLPPETFDAGVDAVRSADLCLVVGTSGLVHPAAALPDLARGAGVPTVEINPVDTPLSSRVDHRWRATAATALPALVASVAPRPPDTRSGAVSPSRTSAAPNPTAPSRDRRRSRRN